MLPEIVEMLGGSGKFDVRVEFLVCGVVTVGCAVVMLYAHTFLDDDLRPKKEPLKFIPEFMGWAPLSPKRGASAKDGKAM